MSNIERLKRHRSFEGWTEFYRHESKSTGTSMRFAVFLPPRAAAGEPCPVVYFLSGLTCTEENFITKAGVQGHAAKHQLIIVAPDTSPRGAGIPGEDDSWDFGTGAGFYINATQQPWAENYRMYDYIVGELPQIINSHFPALPNREGIMGHSMGGHGALVIGLRNIARYQTISAFAPFCAPHASPIVSRAFTKYLGDNKEEWLKYDASHLIKDAKFRRPLLIDQGTEDEFLKSDLKPHLLEEVCAATGYPLQLRHRQGYDHGYYFIATFIGEHMMHHASLWS